MFKKVSFLAVGLICSVFWFAQAKAQTQTHQVFAAQTQNSLESSAPTAMTNDDSFNFVIANPNTVDPKKFLFELKPGDKTSDYVYIKNNASIPLHFNLYGVDGTKTTQGSFALKTKNETQTNLGKWITFDNAEVDVQPGETKKEKFTVNIPPETPQETYSGGVAAEKVKADNNNPNILIAVRIGLRVDVKVTKNPQPIAKKYNDITDNSWFQGYFWLSVVAFVISAGLLGWSYLGNGKSAKKVAIKKKNR